MDKIKVYIKCNDKIEISITKRKSIILIHKSCLKGR